jgi:hypothetical protein
MADPRGARETAGADPIDVEIGTAPALPAALTRLAFLFRTRAALGLGPIMAPAMLFVPFGVLLGPQVLNILSVETLGHLDTVVSVSLAVLGVFVGAAFGFQAGVARRVFLAASAEATATLAVVSAAMFVLLTQWNVPLAVAPLVVALALGVCAAPSSASTSDGSDDPVRRVATRIADLDDVVPIVIGGLVLAAVTRPGLGAIALHGLVTCLVGLGIGLAGWLLFERAHGPAERNVFVLGALVLLGGSAAYLGASPLLSGLAAGIFWTLAPGRADDIIRSDLQRVQHPLIVLLLITAGATLEPSQVAVWLFAPFVLFRLLGKLSGGWVAARLAPGVAPADLGAYLLPPGVLGIAFALNFHQISPGATGVAVVSAIAAGSLASELLAALVVPAPRRS